LRPRFVWPALGCAKKPVHKSTRFTSISL
jgi:hypothetical protein